MPRQIEIERVDREQVGLGGATQFPAPVVAEADAVALLTARLDPVALGLSLGAVCGTLLILATSVLVLKGGQSVGEHLALLSWYVPGYRISPAGSLVGGLYAAAAAFLLGWLVAHLRNFLLRMCLWLLKFWANLSDTYFLDRFD